MGRICLDMLRKRAEHNEGLVSTLEEVSLHQQDIEKIEALGHLCRHLKIIYLQNNLIGRLENLHRLKELEYLNMAINNIQKIENLQRCESLNKLDFTLNFIPKAGLLSVQTLQANENLRELFLVGNPCADWDGYREYVVATLPLLRSFDGTEITPSERIVAKQNFAQLHARLLQELRDEGVDLNAALKYADANDELSEDEEEEGDEQGTGGWSIKQRLKDHRENRRQQEEAATKAQRERVMQGDSVGPRELPRRTGFDPLPDDGTRVYQKNEGKWDFSITESEDGLHVVLDVAVPRYMDTSLIDVDVQPRLIRCLIKGRLLQLELHAEVKSDSSTAQRSKTTGHLVVTMPMVHPTNPKYRVKEKMMGTAAATLVGKPHSQGRSGLDKKKTKLDGIVDFRNVVKRRQEEENTPAKLEDSASCDHQGTQSSARLIEELPDADSSDEDDEVPPLMQ